MAETTLETFRCMMCGHEHQEQVPKGEDKEHSCPKCRSNSIRRVKKAVSRQPSAISQSPTNES